jgi:hypothetical protein
MRREGDDANVIFFSRKYLGCPGVTMESDLKENIRNFKVCTDFTMLKVNVPYISSGT